MKPVSEFVIDRRVWMRGHRDKGRLLCERDERRQQCCVGIYLSACGVPDDVLYGHGIASELARENAPGWLLGVDEHDADAAVQLYDTNDDPTIDETTRERLITEEFAAQGIRVTFTDGLDDA